ncbi:MAG: three-Cys-motif partner protein TcmP [Gammaproteobacteria bacterium]|nr:three-Cys-motif partner protein TcmP [Gammaproteobacteria bacterium]MDJ0891797.1 three-Cys-motif partner protein TcmP [Gammaproteobacteria bacterium]
MEDKHRLLLHYASLFLRSMRHKWEILVYLDLFAGPGLCHVRDTTRFYRSSPTAILTIPERFDRYIFCEAESGHADALRQRVARDAPDRHVAVLSGDANALVYEALAKTPTATRSHRVLSFCFLDPFQPKNLSFKTIARLADRYMDFLVLIPSGMDANRNEHNYTRESNTTLDDFLGNSAWRDRWSGARNRGQTFEKFVVEEFSRAMTTLDYIDPGLENTAVVRSQDKNLLLYRLALYSRNKLGAKFWRESRKYTDPQLGWDF